MLCGSGPPCDGLEHRVVSRRSKRCLHLILGDAGGRPQSRGDAPSGAHSSIFPKCFSTPHASFFGWLINATICWLTVVTVTHGGSVGCVCERWHESNIHAQGQIHHLRGFSLCWRRFPLYCYCCVWARTRDSVRRPTLVSERDPPCILPCSGMNVCLWYVQTIFRVFDEVCYRFSARTS